MLFSVFNHFSLFFRQPHQKMLRSCFRLEKCWSKECMRFYSAKSIGGDETSKIRKEKRDIIGSDKLISDDKKRMAMIKSYYESCVLKLGTPYNH